LVAFSIALGLALMVVQPQYQKDRGDDRDVCKVFTFGESAFGSCDGFGGSPMDDANAMKVLRNDVRLRRVIWPSETL